MASTYSTNLALELIGTGDQAGTWGTTTNTNLGTLIEQAISGYVTQAVATGTDTTITIPNGATGVARNMYIEMTGTGGTNTNLIVPANKKLYFIYNNSTGAVTVKVSGQTGVSVAQGSKVILVSNGTDVVAATSYGTGSGTVTSVGQSFTGGIISVSGSPVTTSGTLALTVAGTSGGIPYFSSSSAWASSAALAANALVIGGGAGVAPSTITTGTGVVTALGVNTGSSGAFVVNGGALGTPSSGTVTNLTGTASININGTVGATTPNTGAFTTLTTSSTVTLNGGTANGVLYLNGSKVATSGTAVTYNGTNFATTADAYFNSVRVGLGASSISTNTAVSANGLGSNTTGARNTAVGYNCMTACTTSNDNACFGYGAGAALTTSSGGLNTLIGGYDPYNWLKGPGGSLTTVYYNVAIGNGALPRCTTGGSNIAIGYSALWSTTGGGNVAIGNQAASNLTTGSYNIHIGNAYGTYASSATVNFEVVMSTSGATGKGESTGFLDFGNIYNTNNTTTWNTTSDRRIKKNIVDNTIGLEKIRQLRIRNFEYRLPEEVDPELKPSTAINKSGTQLGVIAQEIQQVLPECVHQESTGVLTVNSDNLIWYLVNAVKELSAQVEELKAKLGA